MGTFFDSRLDGYEEHQLTCIESTQNVYPFDGRNFESLGSDLCAEGKQVKPACPFIGDHSCAFLLPRPKNEYRLGQRSPGGVAPVPWPDGAVKEQQSNEECGVY